MALPVFLLILILLAIAVNILINAYKGNKSVVMKMLYAMVTEAEKELGGGTGSLKLAMVVEAIYPKLPAIIKLVVSDEIITRWVEEALTAAKDVWQKNGKIAEYISADVAKK